MNKESFKSTFLGQEIIIVIDVENDGHIVDVQSPQRESLEVSESSLKFLERKTETVRHDICVECKREALESENHIKGMTSQDNYI